MQFANQSNDEPPSQSAREKRIEDAMEQFLLQLETGLPPNHREFLDRFPDVAHELAGQLETLEFLQHASPQIRPGGAVDATVDQLGDRATLGDFRLLHPIGRGGMGVVYEAIQLSLDRRVAVKVLPFAALLDARQRQRFQNEARAAATLDHPHIVPIHFVGIERGVHFYAMQLIDGQSLSEVITSLRDFPSRSGCDEQDSSPQDVPLGNGHPASRQSSDNPRSSTWGAHRREAFYREVARIGAEAATALQHAHEQGVVHRDVKPANLLLDEAGKVWVTDFGLARRDHHDSITDHGDVFGTLAYMSPEQKAGSQLADARSDIYSLAVSLFELLTLEQPGESHTQGPFVAVGSEKAALGKLSPRVPADLQTITLKALSTEPQDRYQTAQAMAEDLNRFRAGRTILARCPSLFERTLKWTLRRRMLATTIAVSAALLLVTLTIATVLLGRAERRTHAALAMAKQHSGHVEKLLYQSDMQLAYRAWQANRPAQVRDLLARHIPQSGAPDLRGFEWRVLAPLVREPQCTIVGKHVGPANQLAVFPGGQRVASVGDDNRLRIWDLHTGDAVAALDPGPTSVEPLISVAISPDGSTIATGSDMVLLWDAATGQPIGPLTSFGTNVQSIAFAPDGNLIAAASRYDCVRVLTPDGEVVKEMEDGSRHESLEFTTSGKQLLVPIRNPIQQHGHHEEFIRSWDTVTFSDTTDYFVPGQSEYKRYTLAAASPDGSFYAMCEQSALKPIRLINPGTGEVLFHLPQNHDHVQTVAISPDSRRLAAAYKDGSIGYWQLLKKQNGKFDLVNRQRVIHAHQGHVKSVQFADDTRIVSCGADGLVKTWDLTVFDWPRIVEPGVSRLHSVGLDGFGGIYVGSGMGAVRKIHTDGKSAIDVLNGENSRQLTFTRVGDRIAAWLLRRDRIELRDLESGRLFHDAPVEPGAEHACRVLDGSVLAVVERDGNLRFWDFIAKTPIKQVSIDGPAVNPPYRCYPSPDGRYVLCSSEAGLTFVDAASHQIVKQLSVQSNSNRMIFNVSGNVLATAHNDGRIRLWQWPQGRLLGELTGHKGPVKDIAFVSDELLISVGIDGTTRTWSVHEQFEFGILDRRDWEGRAIAVSPTGDSVCVGYEDAANNRTMIVRIY